MPAFTLFRPVQSGCSSALIRAAMVAWGGDCATPPSDIKDGVQDRVASRWVVSWPELNLKVTVIYGTPERDELPSWRRKRAVEPGLYVVAARINRQHGMGGSRVLVASLINHLADTAC